MAGNDAGQAMISLVRDIAPGFAAVIAIVCYVLALAAFLQGLFRLLRMSNGGSGAPGGWGAVLSFVITAIMATFPSWLDAAGNSLFGVPRPSASAGLAYGGGAAGHDALLAAVFTIVRLVGLCAFLRGVFVLRAAADHRPGASAGGACAHIVGGIGGWHITGVIDALQNSLGIQVLRFS